MGQVQMRLSFILLRKRSSQSVSWPPAIGGDEKADRPESPTGPWGSRAVEAGCRPAQPQMGSTQLGEQGGTTTQPRQN